VLRTDGGLERFDLSKDPHATQALSANRDRFEELLQSAGIEFDYTADSASEFSEPTPEMRKNLKALGYIH
jgi:hypothetical protein